MIAAARAAAFDVLEAVETGRLDLGEALARARRGLDDPRDQVLLAELAAGTLRWRGALDYQLARASGRPLERLDAAVLRTLRLGLYQLLHLDRVPAHAVVHDAVALVRRAGVARAAPLVNAVLRRLARERDALQWPERPTAVATPADRERAIEYGVHTCSHPRWLVERWLAREPLDLVDAWLRFNNAPAPLCLRADTRRTSRDELAVALAAHGVRTRPTRFAPHGLVVESGRPLATPLAAEGLFLVQDEASQLVPELLRPGPGARVLDACAAPGGKTVAIAGMLGAGTVVAADVRARRVRILAATLRHHDVRAPVVQVAPEGEWPFRQVFTHVLVDAPCTGLGTIRRNPDIRWRRTPMDLPRMAALQTRLLDRAARVLVAGGRLVYSTCSSEPEENEEVAAAFLARHPDFAPRAVQELDSLPDALRSLGDERGWLRTSPPRHGLEAFFAAVFERRG